MPFKSNKQKRYMHSKIPKIANNWEKEYQDGGPVDDIYSQPERIDPEGYSIDETYGPTEEQITQQLQTLNQETNFNPDIGPDGTKETDRATQAVDAKESRQNILNEIYDSLWYLDTASLHNLSPNPAQMSNDVLWSIYHNNQESIENSKLDGNELPRLDIAKIILHDKNIERDEMMDNVFENLGPEELELLNTHYRNKAMDYQNQLLQDKKEYDENSVPLKDLIPKIKKFFDWESSKILQEGGKLEGPSHDDGGIPGKVKNSDQPLEFEGGEVVINTSVNKAADKHEEGLLALNKNPDEFEIVRKTDAGKRQNRIG